ncbi:MAG TPA: VOC family protein [Haliangiales bacterium]|nr:VOC family protein [Haliangiales bacterium]
MTNAINWFEIPVADMSRAIRFYEAALGTKLKTEELPGTKLAVFPGDGVAGALKADGKRHPTTEGSLVYFHVGHGSGALDTAIERVRAAGGQILVPVTDIGKDGWFAVVGDSEGNAVGLHAPR